MTSIVCHGDARALQLPDESVDLIVTSPPYFGLRSYTDGGEHYATQIGAEATPREFIDALVECTREMVRVLKPSGSIFVNLGDKYAGGGGQWEKDERPDPGRRRAVSGKISTGGKTYGMRAKSLMMLPERYRIAAVDELGLIARAVIVWAKPNGLPESVTDRVRRSHEDWVHLVKQPRYFSAVDEIREPHAGRQGGTLGRLPGSVWSIASQPLRVPAELNVNHFAAFPMEWPRRIISGWCPPDGVVLDPFGGTGTTALVASVLGRVGISVDASKDYGRIALWRTTDSKQRTRAGQAKHSKPLPLVGPEPEPADTADPIMAAIATAPDDPAMRALWAAHREVWTSEHTEAVKARLAELREAS